MWGERWTGYLWGCPVWRRPGRSRRGRSSGSRRTGSAYGRRNWGKNNSRVRRVGGDSPALTCRKGWGCRPWTTWPAWGSSPHWRRWCCRAAWQSPGSLRTSQLPGLGGRNVSFLILTTIITRSHSQCLILFNAHPEWINVSDVKYYQLFLSARVEGVMPSYDYLCEDSHWTGLGPVEPSKASVCPVSGTSWWFLTSPPVTRIIIRRSSELPSRGWEMIEGDDNGVLGANTYQWSTFNNHLPSSTSRQLLSLASHIPLCLSRIQLTLSPTHSHILYVLTTFTQGSSIFKRFGSARKYNVVLQPAWLHYENRVWQL